MFAFTKILHFLFIYHCVSVFINIKCAIHLKNRIFGTSKLKQTTFIYTSETNSFSCKIKMYIIILNVFNIISVAFIHLNILYF